jgi:predicted ATPase
MSGPRPGKSARPTSRVTAPGTLVEEQAEACYLEALELARRQRGKLLELRATTSLSQLWARQGKVKGAHGLLSEVYGWFVEGFDTPDLTEAKVLLEELERGAPGKVKAGFRGPSRGHPRAR